MIAFMPPLYDDELCFSWFARYYCFSGYPAYSYALDDLFEKRTIHFSAEYINSRFSEEAKGIINDIVPMENLILEHTMFPIVRFTNHDRLNKGLDSMIKQEGKSGDILPIPQHKSVRYLRYCPCCVSEQRKKFGEAFWTRKANIKGLDICAKHKCRLKDTDILISGKQSPRLHIAEMVIKDIEPEYVEGGVELKFARYLTDVFLATINKENQINISDFLKSKLEGTKYLCPSGQQRNVSLFYNDMMALFSDMPDKGIKDVVQIQKVLNGYRTSFYEICQMAFFLNVQVLELVNPTLPEKSQQEIFNEKVEALKATGLSSKKIARMIGADPHTVRMVGVEKTKAEHDHSVRKGIPKEDWSKMDEDTLPLVKDTCQKLYNGGYGEPKRVTIGTVQRLLNWPSKRLDYLPKCRNEVKRYEESQEEFWARKIVWQYRKLLSEGEDITYRSLTRPLNLRRENFISSLPFLFHYCEKEEKNHIKAFAE